MQSTSTKTSTPTQLPIMKYFDDSAAKGKQAIDKWRKGEKPIASLLGIVLIGVAGYGFVVYAVPIIFVAIGQVLAVIISIALIVFALMISPVVYKLFRRIVRSFHKALIRWAPFDELEEQLAQMWAAHKKFLAHKAKIKQLRNDFEQMARTAQNDADEAKDEVQRHVRKATELKKEMDDLIKEKGKGAKETDEYVAIQQKFINANSAGKRLSATMNKNIEWTTKYAARSNIFANLDRKLAIGATLLENKNRDFEESINIMKKDWEMANASRGATTILNQILGPGGENWQLDYALEFVNGKIAEDLAITAQNLEDLERNTVEFNFDSDDAYAELMKISEKIDAGQIETPDADKISNVNHKLTSDERSSAGPLGNVFN